MCMRMSRCRPGSTPLGVGSFEVKGSLRPLKTKLKGCNKVNIFKPVFFFALADSMLK